MYQSLILKRKMPKYHFVYETEEDLLRRQITPNRVTATYSASFHGGLGNFSKAELYDNSERIMTFGNCEGSLIVVDETRNGINKLHVGELVMGTPHVESKELPGQEQGPRADLFDFDIDYAKHQLKRLRDWRSEEVKDKCRKEWSGMKWYCVPYRMAQLDISPEGLERKIQEMEAHISILKGDQNRHFVRTRARKIELMAGKVVPIMTFNADVYDSEQEVLIEKGVLGHRQREKISKVIADPEVLRIVRDMRILALEVMDFIAPKIDLERAKHYWQNLAAWRNL